MNLPRNEPTQPDGEQLERIAQALERLERRFDDFARVYLDSRFPFGRPVDRWRKSA